MRKLDRSFYIQNTIDAAKAVLGKVLVHVTDEGPIAGRIVETEAYLHDDPACHASRGMTRRNAVMFGEPGRAYVYLTYGMHYCLNFVTQPAGTPEAILVRALQPLEGVDLMRRNRGADDVHRLCSGPAKLTQALGIDISVNDEDLLGDRLYVVDDGTCAGEIASRPRIGISMAADKLWRFYPVEYAEWVSRR